MTHREILKQLSLRLEALGHNPEVSIDQNTKVLEVESVRVWFDGETLKFEQQGGASGLSAPKGQTEKDIEELANYIHQLLCLRSQAS
jgi:hypothetical protein